MSKNIDEFFSFDYNSKQIKPIENAVSESVSGTLSQSATTRKGKAIMSEEKFDEFFKEIYEDLNK
jgi:hypothetical protein